MTYPAPMKTGITLVAAIKSGRPFRRMGRKRFLMYGEQKPTSEGLVCQPSFSFTKEDLLAEDYETDGAIAIYRSELVAAVKRVEGAWIKAFPMPIRTEDALMHELGLE